MSNNEEQAKESTNKILGLYSAGIAGIRMFFIILLLVGLYGWLAWHGGVYALLALALWEITSSYYQKLEAKRVHKKLVDDLLRGDR